MVSPSILAQDHSQNCQQGFKMGLLLDLSGAQQTLGQAALNGFMLAISQIPEKDSTKIFFSLNNTKTNSKAAQKIAESLAPEVSLATGFTDNNAVLASAKYFEKHNVPFISIGASSPSLPKDFNNDVFLIPFGDNAQAAAAADFARKNFGKKAVVIWDKTSDYTTILPKYFETAFTKEGGQILSFLSFGHTCDIGYLAKKIKNLSPKPSFVYLAGLPRCIGEQIHSLRKNGMALPIIGGDGLDTPNLTQPFSLTDVWMTTHAYLASDNPNPETKKFLALYKKAYGQQPQDAFAALGFDAANLIIKAVNQTCAQDKSSLSEEFESIKNYAGVCGKYLYSANNHVPQKTVWIIKIKNGKRILADQITPKNVPAPIADKKIPMDSVKRDI